MIFDSFGYHCCPHSIALMKRFCADGLPDHFADDCDRGVELLSGYDFPGRFMESSFYWR